MSISQRYDHQLKLNRKEHTHHTHPHPYTNLPISPGLGADGVLVPSVDGARAVKNVLVQTLLVLRKVDFVRCTTDRLWISDVSVQHPANRYGYLEASISDNDGGGGS